MNLEVQTGIVGYFVKCFETDQYLTTDGVCDYWKSSKTLNLNLDDYVKLYYWPTKEAANEAIRQYYLGRALDTKQLDGYDFVEQAFGD